MKLVGALVLVSTLAFSASALADGVVGGERAAQAVGAALDGKTLTCSSAADHVTLAVGSDGQLRMVADYADAISGVLDTSDEGDGAECGGLTAKLDTRTGGYVVDDAYNDCERGFWGYRVILGKKELASGQAFTARGYATVAGARNGNVATLSCVAK